jgi:hypothetical protein
MLAGCDMRADIVNSLLGDMAFYRNHSEMHVEFHRNNSAKIKLLERMFLGGELDGRTVVDGLASAGTLGLLAAASGPESHSQRCPLPAVKISCSTWSAVNAGVELKQITTDGLP